MAHRYVSTDPQSPNRPARYTAADIGFKIRYVASDVPHFVPRYASTDVKLNRYIATDVDDRH